MEILELKAEITNRYPDIVFTDKSDSENLILEFNNGKQLDYNYFIWFGTESICVLIEANCLNSSGNEYFWHYPFDTYGKGSIEEKYIECLDFIFEQLDILTKFQTRIIQKNNLISQSFICEYFDNNTWTTLYKHSSLKTNFVFPKIIGKQKIYE